MSLTPTLNIYLFEGPILSQGQRLKIFQFIVLLKRFICILIEIFCFLCFIQKLCIREPKRELKFFGCKNVAESHPYS
jgi:hypothetical protein